MSQNKDSIGKTITVAVALCLVCSVFVSASAVFLRPLQEANKALDKQRNIVSVAGLDEPGRSAGEIFDESIEARVVDLQTGRFADDIDPATYDQRQASKDPQQSGPVAAERDIAGIKRKERYATVYLTRDPAGDIDRIILPVRGYGLWSTLWGFLALDGDGNTIIGLSFYDHAETPGLGGEVDNPNWKAQWAGKQVYGPEGEPRLGLAKGGVDPGSPNAKYQVDGLSGATLTARGVTNLLQYWMSDEGFKPFLRNLAEGRA